MPAKRVIVIGATGQIGAAMVSHFRACREVIPLGHRDLELSDLRALEPALARYEFDLLVNCAAFASVDGCEANPELAATMNTEVPVRLGAICQARGVQFVHLGTDYVFDGEAQTPYLETSVARPLSVYGASKLAGEQGVLDQDPGALVLRTSLLFSLVRPGFPEWVLDRARESAEAIPVVGDKFANLTRAEGLPVLLDQLLSIPDQAHGLYNVVHSGFASAADQARFILQRAAYHQIPVRTTEVREVTMASVSQARAPRPRYSVLCSGKFTAATGKHPHSWQTGLDAHLEAIAARYQD